MNTGRKRRREEEQDKEREEGGSMDVRAVGAIRGRGRKTLLRVETSAEQNSQTRILKDSYRDKRGETFKHTARQ